MDITFTLLLIVGFFTLLWGIYGLGKRDADIKAINLDLEKQQAENTAHADLVEKSRGRMDAAVEAGRNAGDPPSHVDGLSDAQRNRIIRR